MSTPTPIRIVTRQPSDLESLVGLFEATFRNSGYPIEGPPSRANPECWLSCFAGEDVSAEVEGLVAVQIPGQGDTETATIESTETKQQECSALLAAPRKVLGHVSMRNVAAGSIYRKLWDDNGNNPDASLWEVGRLAVDPASQGMRVGARLMHAVESYAQRAGKTLVLGVIEKDVAAIQMYKRRGWKTLAGLDKFVGQDGKVHNEYFYYKTPS